MKVLITESEDFSLNALKQLQKYFEVTTHNIKSIEELIENCTDVEVLFVRLRFKLTKQILEKIPKLKFILTATTGLDHIDVPFFEANGGKVISLKDEIDFLDSIPSTAEHTWALILALIKKIPSSFDDVKMGNWNRDNFKGNNLKGKKIAILGLGRVGKQVAKYAEAFGMEIGYFDVVIQNNNYLNFLKPEEMVAWADVISIHIPYTIENKHFVNKELLEHCKPTCILINTSRGSVWDENAIATLLQQRKIKGIATDVFSDEFEKGHIPQNQLVLLANEKHNIIITPHIAGATYESMSLTEEFIVDKFISNIK